MIEWRVLCKMGLENGVIAKQIRRRLHRHAQTSRVLMQFGLEEG